MKGFFIIFLDCVWTAGTSKGQDIDCKSGEQWAGLCTGEEKESQSRAHKPAWAVWTWIEQHERNPLWTSGLLWKETRGHKQSKGTTTNKTVCMGFINTHKIYCETLRIVYSFELHFEISCQDSNSTVVKWASLCPMKDPFLISFILLY